MDRDRIVEHYKILSQNKGFEIDQVRKDLALNNVPENEIRAIVRLVDEHVRTQALKKSSQLRGTQLIIAGVILTLIGLLIFVITQFGYLDVVDGVVFIYGPVTSGVALLVTGFAKRRQEEVKKRRLQYQPPIHHRQDQSFY